VDEHISMSTHKTSKVSTRPSLVSEESFVLPAHPANKIPIEVIPNLTKCRRIKTPIIGMPTSQNGIENPRKVQQSLIALQLDMPAVDASVDLFHRVPTDRRKKIRAYPTLRINRSPRAEHIAEKVKADSRIVSRTIDILTVNYHQLKLVAF
jgi:hypothetical protein